MAKWGVWEKLVKNSDVYLSRTKVVFSGKYSEKELTGAAGIAFGAKAEEIEGIDTTERGVESVIYGFDGKDAKYYSWRRKNEWIPVMMTYRVYDMDGREELSAIKPIEVKPAVDAKAEEKSEGGGVMGGASKIRERVP